MIPSSLYIVRPFRCVNSVTGRARGGNDIRLKWNGRNTSLHSVWDGMLIAKLQRTLTPVRTRYDDFLEYLLHELEGHFLNSTSRWLGCPYSALARNQIVLGQSGDQFVAKEGCVENWMEETHQLNCGGVWSFDTSSVARENMLSRGMLPQSSGRKSMGMKRCMKIRTANISISIYPRVHIGIGL